MADTNHSTADEENEPTTDYANSEGTPLVCPDCGEYVAVHYRPQGEYRARHAGFHIECDCPVGYGLSGETVKHMHPPWFAEMVMETEDDGEYWLEFYLHEERNVSSWVGDGDE